ncbi:unnamed protein product [Echinostoma caproni]|uniref:Uncharacterized protein n=1 Tax=Echinostoma caproni TaxID=27848 RepID=A0A183AT67_9TREM|nr:unnamed protein product [Echinostoma caproni]
MNCNGSWPVNWRSQKPNAARKWVSFENETSWRTHLNAFMMFFYICLS